MSPDFAYQPGPQDFVPGTGKTWTTATHSAEETQELGRKLARRLSPPCIILLEGELGAGKTTLVKGIVEGLGAARPEDVTSPTFALVHEYGAGRVYHVDLYRIETVAELGTLGLDDILGGNSIVLVEWGEKLGRSFQGPALRIRLEYEGDNRRRITVEDSAKTP
jgi:tRNA threonylcarbamoyladenosine biosynthesis protein TsaE